jgi:hypothetical protein
MTPQYFMDIPPDSRGTIPTIDAERVPRDVRHHLPIRYFVPRLSGSLTKSRHFASHERECGQNGSG